MANKEKNKNPQEEKVSSASSIQTPTNVAGVMKTLRGMRTYLLEAAGKIAEKEISRPKALESDKKTLTEALEKMAEFTKEEKLSTISENIDQMIDILGDSEVLSALKNNLIGKAIDCNIYADEKKARGSNRNNHFACLGFAVYSLDTIKSKLEDVTRQLKGFESKEEESQEDQMGKKLTELEEALSGFGEGLVKTFSTLKEEREKAIQEIDNSPLVDEKKVLEETEKRVKGKEEKITDLMIEEINNKKKEGGTEVDETQIILRKEGHSDISSGEYMKSTKARVTLEKIVTEGPEKIVEREKKIMEKVKSDSEMQDCAEDIKVTARILSHVSGVVSEIKKTLGDEYPIFHEYNDDGTDREKQIDRYERLFNKLPKYGETNAMNIEEAINMLSKKDEASEEEGGDSTAEEKDAGDEKKADGEETKEEERKEEKKPKSKKKASPKEKKAGGPKEKSEKKPNTKD